MISVTLVEDSGQYSEILKQRINAEKDMKCISQYPNVTLAKQGILKDKPEVILMDIKLPDGSGVDLVRFFTDIDLQCHIVMCTSFDDDENVYKSLVSGALGYVLKNDVSTSITDSIRDIVNGGSPMSPQIARKVLSFFSQESKSDNKLSSLTKREDELLVQLSKGMLYKEVAEKLEISIETVRKHAYNIYKKLQVNNRTEAINKYFNRKQTP